MKKEAKQEKKLSLKKIQHTRLNSIKGGGSGEKFLDGNVTNGDTTTSKYCQMGTTE
ncbi:hypothetical protein [Chryseobacterium oncorhynchi]|uniref:hypothetical protein n=1 Tax=Chryseobacterium oncorhynchi TaxID=741074 RepID=UPI0014032C4C|nr:hypothetical protein [Chryseobacterium oncorhynchi]